MGKRSDSFVCSLETEGRRLPHGCARKGCSKCIRPDKLQSMETITLVLDSFFQAGFPCCYFGKFPCPFSDLVDSLL